MSPLRILAALPLLLAAAPSPPLSPGLWEETLVFALDQVNGSDTLAEHMQGVLPTPAPRRACLSAADLADPAGVLLDAANGTCSFSRLTMTGGKMAVTGDCAAGPQTLHVSGTGGYTAGGYDLDFTGSGASNGVTMTFRGRDSGRRIGQCPAPGATPNRL